MAAKFDVATEEAKNFTSLTDEEKLNVYSLYKQATVGDVNIDRPGFFDMKGKAKWDAWDKQKGKTQDAAKAEYVSVVVELAKKYGFDTIVEKLQ